MSVNRFRPHIMVLPEDDANRQIADGFHLEVPMQNYRQMQILPVAGGWTAVMDRFRNDQIVGMRNFPFRLMVLLIDFDGRLNRLNEMKASVPADLQNRVFVLGTWSQPERLRPATFGGLETIGKLLAQDCRENTGNTWNHELLRHNSQEVQRLREPAREILFLP